MIVPVTGERLTEVQAIGWGDGHEILKTNRYQNPFWNTTGFFKTSGGHASRISVFWHVAAGGAERAQFHGDRRSFIMKTPEGSPNTIVEITDNGKMTIDENGYPAGRVSGRAFEQPDHFDKLPEPAARENRSRQLARLPDTRVRPGNRGGSAPERECLGIGRLHGSGHYCARVGVTGRRTDEDPGLRHRTRLTARPLESRRRPWAPMAPLAASLRLRGASFFSAR